MKPLAHLFKHNRPTNQPTNPSRRLLQTGLLALPLALGINACGQSPLPPPEVTVDNAQVLVTRPGEGKQGVVAMVHPSDASKVFGWRLDSRVGQYPVAIGQLNGGLGSPEVSAQEVDYDYKAPGDDYETTHVTPKIDDFGKGKPDGTVVLPIVDKTHWGCVDAGNAIKAKLFKRDDYQYNELHVGKVVPNPASVQATQGQYSIYGLDSAGSQSKKPLFNVFVQNKANATLQSPAYLAALGAVAGEKDYDALEENTFGGGGASGNLADGAFDIDPETCEWPTRKGDYVAKTMFPGIFPNGSIGLETKTPYPFKNPDIVNPR
jgi:hypothetical protein